MILKLNLTSLTCKLFSAYYHPTRTSNNHVQWASVSAPSAKQRNRRETWRNVDEVPDIWKSFGSNFPICRITLWLAISGTVYGWVPLSTLGWERRTVKKASNEIDSSGLEHQFKYWFLAYPWARRGLTSTYISYLRWSPSAAMLQQGSKSYRKWLSVDYTRISSLLKIYFLTIWSAARRESSD